MFACLQVLPRAGLSKSRLVAATLSKAPVFGRRGRNMLLSLGKMNVKKEERVIVPDLATLCSLGGRGEKRNLTTSLHAEASASSRRPFLEYQLLLGINDKIARLIISPIFKEEVQPGALAAKNDTPPMQLKLCSARQQRHTFAQKPHATGQKPDKNLSCVHVTYRDSLCVDHRGWFWLHEMKNITSHRFEVTP